MKPFTSPMKGAPGVAKTKKLILEYPNNEGYAFDEIQRLCEEIPEVKLMQMGPKPKSFMTEFTLKYPIKVKDYLYLYLQQHDMEKRISYGQD